MSGILSFHKGGGVKHTHGASSGSGSGTTQQGNIAGNIVIGSPTSQSGPGQMTGPRNKLKKRKKQALQNLQINPNYITGVVQDAQNQLSNIVQNKNILQNLPGDVIINPNVVGDVFKDYKEGDKLNSAQQVFANFYGSSTPNKYQQELQKFITTSPLHREVYKQSGLKGAGLNLFMTEFPEKFASSTGLGSLITAMGKGKDKVVQAGKKIAEVLNPKDAKNLDINQQENETVVETLGKQDPNRFGSLMGDRFDTVEDIFDPEASAAMASLDPEKIAMDIGLTPGTVFNPVESDLQRKINFVNQVFGTDFGGSVDMPNADTIEQLFQKAKQQQGGEIRDTIQNQQGEEESPVAGQFNFEDFITPYQDTITDINLTGQMEPVDPNSFPEGGVDKSATQAGQTLLFTDGTEVQEPFNTGLDVVGDSVFPSDAGSQTALDILNSNANPYFSGYPTMRFDDGGYAKMSTYQKLKMMADSIG